MKIKGKWKISESKKIFENPWITLYDEKGIRPDGKKGDHALIIYKPGIAVLPIDDEGNIYLTKEYRYAIDNVSIESVAGGIEKGDAPIDAAKKELEEELGIIAEEWINLGVYNPLTETVYSPSTFYIAQKLKFTKQHIDGTEDIKIIKMPLKTAVDKVLDGEIHFTVACLIILLAWEKLGK